MSELTTIARPYAKAAFDYAVENKGVEQWLSMLCCAAQVANHESIQRILSGTASAGRQAEIIVEICAEQLDEYGQNLIKLMAENGRLIALPQVYELFVELKAEYDKEIDVDITSAVDLDDKQQASISASLEKRLARKIKLNCNLDSGLVAGMVIKAGDTVIDGSVRSKLNRLADSLQA